MCFEKRFLDIRKKERNFAIGDGKATRYQGPEIARYERDDMKPSIEVASNMADILEVFLDYLVGEGDSKVLDKKPFRARKTLANYPKSTNRIFSTL